MYLRMWKKDISKQISFECSNLYGKYSEILKVACQRFGGKKLRWHNSHEIMFGSKEKKISSLKFSFNCQKYSERGKKVIRDNKYILLL